MRQGRTCAHTSYITKTMKSLALTTYWKECLDCGQEFDFRKIPLPKTRHDIRNTGGDHRTDRTP